jgi:hypothetical protein
VSAFTDSLSVRIDRIANPTVAANMKVTPVPAAAVTMAKALLAAREAKMSGATLAFDLGGGTEFYWCKPNIAVQINAAGVTVVVGASQVRGEQRKTSFGAIDATFLAAFDAVFVPAVTS